MNILHTECSLNWGGQEFRTLLEHRYLNSSGHKSWLMCHPESQLYKKATGLATPNLLAVNLKRTWRFDVALRIYLLCRYHRIDVINAHGSRDATLCLPSFLMGIPLFRSRQIINPIKKSFSYRHACTQVIASAQAIKASMVNAGVQAKKITVVNEGVDLAEFNPMQECNYLRKEFNLSKNQQVVINIGMLREDKGQRYFLAAAQQLLKKQPTLKFFLIGESVGDHDLENELRANIRAYGIEDRFVLTGYRQDISAFMNLADLVVISSIGEANRGLPHKLLLAGKRWLLPISADYLNWLNTVRPVYW